MSLSVQLAHRIGHRDGVENQRLEYAGKPFLLEDEALEAWLRRTGATAVRVPAEVVDAYRAGYGAGADMVQLARPIDPKRRRAAFAAFARLELGLA